VATTKIRIFENNLAQLSQSFRKAKITLDELKTIDSSVKLYRAAGRMFMSGSALEFKEDIEKSLKAYEEDIKLEKDSKIQSEKKVEELTKAIQELMKKK